VKAVVRTVEPAHRPVWAQALDHGVHEVASAERVARAVQAQDRNGDPRQVRIAQLIGLPRRM
jgi:hypothetical protein